jgi:hypothetical protein
MEDRRTPKKNLTFRGGGELRALTVKRDERPTYSSRRWNGPNTTSTMKKMMNC